MRTTHSQFTPAGAETRPATVEWTPAVDIVEHPDSFELFADVPGVSPEHIDISLLGNVLTVAGERGMTQAGHARAYGERVTGRFCRRFTLPASVDGDAIEASTQHGTLQLRIPKQPEVQPRRIDVQYA